jgi:uncharacterized protein YdaU (DUF1376 family)
MPLYIGDYLADTMHLTAAEHGAYLLLIMHYWRSGPLPDDERLLAAIARTERKAWAAEIGPVVRPFFQVEGGKLHHKRIDRELETAERNVEQRRAAGRASAERRAQQRQPDETGNEVGNGAGNEKPTTVENSLGGPLGDPFQRNRRPSPSPSPEEGSLRSPPGARSPRGERDADDDPAFAAFWAAYPRREDKGHARKAWKSAIRKATAEQIMAGLARCAFSPERRFQPLPATWLNGERWSDQAAEAAETAAGGLETPGEPPGEPPRDASALPALPPGYDPPDAWGARAWLLRQPGVAVSTHDNGRSDYTLHGWFVEDVIPDLMAAAGILTSVRPNLDALAEWLRDDIELTARPVLDAIRRTASRLDGAIRSLRVFDADVRAAARRAA